MSRNEWEQGDFILSTAEFGKFKKTLIESWNTQIENEFSILGRLYEDLRSAGKGKRNFNWSETLGKMIEKTEQRGSWMYKNRTYDFKILDEWQVKRALLDDKVVEQVNGREVVKFVRSAKPHAPKKADFKPLSARSTDTLGMCEASVRFDPKLRKVSWNVSENNHAVDYAREGFLGRKFFELLKKVEWTRNTGGHIFGNDEYNEDEGERHCGGGGSYMKETFGPRGEKAYKDKHGFSRSSSRTAPRRR